MKNNFLKLSLVVGLTVGTNGAFVSNSPNTITDTSTGLMWMDYSLAESNKTTNVSYETAIIHCEDILTVYSNWRAPNLNELYYLAQGLRDSNLSLPPQFKNSSSEYWWASTSLANTTNLAWTVSFVYGGTLLQYRTGKGENGNDLNISVRCVRDDTGISN